MNEDPPSPPFVAAELRCVDVEAMLDAYALQALEPAESRAVAAHLAGCSSCRAALKRSERAGAALGFGVVPVAPPPALRRRLLDEIAHTGTATIPTSASRTPAIPIPGAVPIPRGRRTLLGLAAVAALLLVGLIVAGVLLRHAQDARDHALADQREFAEYLADGGTATALVPAPGAVAADGRGSLIVAPNQPRAALLITGLAVGDGRSYRVWVERAGQRTWLGDLELASDGTGYLMLSAPDPLTTYDTVGIAEEMPGQAAHDLLFAPIHPAS